MRVCPECGSDNTIAIGLSGWKTICCDCDEVFPTRNMNEDDLRDQEFDKKMLEKGDM